MDFWQRARTFAEETAKRSQELTLEAAKRSQEFTIGSSKISDLVSETAKKSKEIAAEATKKADQIKIEAFKRADQIKTLAEGISPQIPLNAMSLIDSSSLSSSSSSTTPSEADLEKFGVTDDLREFVKGITQNTFQDFPVEDEPEISDVPTVSNVRQDLTEWQEKHATLVLLTVKEISRLRYQLCPRRMKEKKFWRIYFILVNSHVALYEKRYMEEAKLKSAEKEKVDRLKEQAPTGTSKPEAAETNHHSKTSSAEQDLDVFLLGDLGSSDEGPDDGDAGFDDDFDNSDDDGEKQPKKL
ncbi:Bsd domain-containing protein [Thalictrum thalictroides]|uniref:Bsd domain-containing protein n=1 Tax=Thalictrum thalictroides TaxID=46969 RepID=A0A7J6WXK0_THATH|nr:Bsd domain-containing protein [Thalictrum thalictroides]